MRKHVGIRLGYFFLGIPARDAAKRLTPRSLEKQAGKESRNWTNSICSTQARGITRLSQTRQVTGAAACVSVSRAETLSTLT